MSQATQQQFSKVPIKELSNEDLGKIARYLWLEGKTVADLVSFALKYYLEHAEAEFEDIGECPNCWIQNHKKVITRGRPAAEALAAKQGNFQVDPALLTDDLYFVFCPECGWTGLPSKSEAAKATI